MFRNVRRQDREISPAQALEIIKDGEYGVMSTIGEDGYAYGIPLNYVYFNEAIYFHCAVEGHKLDNIRYHNKVSFCVVGLAETMPEKFSTRYTSAIVFGTAEEVSGEEKKNAFVAFLQKFTPSHLEKGMEHMHQAESKTKVVKIAIEHISGKNRE